MEPRIMEARFYREEIDKEASLILNLIDQQGPETDRITDLSEEYLDLLYLRDIPIEELHQEPWVQENLKPRWEAIKHDYEL